MTKVLLVHLSDGHQGGGGGIATLRLHLGLREAGIDSRIACRTKTLKSPYITQVPRLPRLEFLLKRVTSRLGLNDIHLVSSFKVRQEQVYQSADVIDFQGIHTNTLSYLALPALTRDKPAVFTMHDMWALTGHCAYSYDCERWKTGCGKCPYPDTHPAIKQDNTRIEWWLKKRAYAHSDLIFVAPSRWLVALAKQSIIGQRPIYRIPYGIDTEVYRPLDQRECQTRLGLPADKKVIMFAALKLNNRRKGGDLLLKALQALPASLKAETVLLTIGYGGESILGAIGMQAFHLGYVDDDHLKAVAYSAADLFLSPTRADNLPLVLLESMACGTPMVSFNVGGVSDLVRPEITGYLVDPESIQGFCTGVIQLLEDESLRAQMGRQCRTIALEEYRRDLQIRRYTQVYRQLEQRGMIQAEGDLVLPYPASDAEESA
jgi:glycosyltransferase involved in cell wall biosynthesis